MGPHLLRRLPLVLARAPRHDRPTAALGCLPALPGPGGHHGRHRGHQLRPRRDADPPRRAPALAVLDRRPRGCRGGHRRGVRQHAASRWGRRSCRARSSRVTAPPSATPARWWRKPARRRSRPPTPHDADAAAADDARRRRRRRRRADLSDAGSARGDDGQAGEGVARRRLRRRHARRRPGGAGASSTACRSRTRGRRAVRSSMQSQIQVLFYTVSPDAPCDVGANPARCSTPGAGGWTRTTPTSSSTSPAARRSTSRWRDSGRTSGSPPSTATWRAGTARRPTCSAPGGPVWCS